MNTKSGRFFLIAIFIGFLIGLFFPYDVNASWTSPSYVPETPGFGTKYPGNSGNGYGGHEYYYFGWQNVYGWSGSTWHSSWDPIPTYFSWNAYIPGSNSGTTKGTWKYSIDGSN